MGRKPLQLLALGAFATGALVGGLGGGGVSAAIVAPIKADIQHLEMMNKDMVQALHAMSQSLDTMHAIINMMQTEMEVFRKVYREVYNRTLPLITDNLTLSCAKCTHPT